MIELNKKFDNLVNILEKNRYSKILVEIIINGKIPYFNIIKKYLVYISLISLLIFINPKMYKDFGEWGMNLLLIILFISPLYKIFPKFKILSKILLLRRQIGIIIGFFILAHLVGFLLKENINILELIKNNIINYKTQLFWGIWGTIFMIFPFITSNNLSQKILKNKWKIFQYGTYLFFIFSVLHIYTLKGELEELAIIFVWLILKFLANKKVVILK